jgi:hypothetical protein
MFEGLWYRNQWRIVTGQMAYTMEPEEECEKEIFVRWQLGILLKTFSRQSVTYEVFLSKQNVKRTQWGMVLCKELTKKSPAFMKREG